MIIPFLPFLASAFAQDAVWPQVNLSVQGTHKIAKGAELRASLHGFWAPSSDGDAAMVFLYAGPKWRLTEGYATAIQIGSVVNWTGEGDLQPLISTWNWFDTAHLHGFVEMDVYVQFAAAAVVPTVYGFQSLDWDGLTPFSLGAHVEEVNTSVNVGPHVGIPLGDTVWIRVNYHRGVQDGGNAIRFNLNLALP